MASAEVQIDSVGMSSPVFSSRYRRSRGVKIELLVSTRNGVPAARSRSTNVSAPGISLPSWTSTPSMSDIQDSTDLDAGSSDAGTAARVVVAGPGERTAAAHR